MLIFFLNEKGKAECKLNSKRKFSAERKRKKMDEQGKKVMVYLSSEI